MKPSEVLSPRFLAHVLLLRPILWAVFGINVRGRENLEGLDRFLVISNHNSHLDTLLLWAALPFGKILRTRTVAASDYFREPRWLFRAVEFLFRPVWVDREGPGGGAMGRIQEALDAGDSVILFPEGTRGEPGELRAFRGGIGRIVAANRSVPVVPVFLEGPERALPRSAPFPVPLWNHVTIAPAQLPRGESGDVTASLQRLLEGFDREARCARQRRPGARRPPFTIAILGIDGSGKSTLSRRLARESSAAQTTCTIADSLEIWEGGRPQELQPLIAERVRRWIGARAKRAESLARYKIPKLAELFLRDHLLEEAGRWYRPASVFMDGMPLLNLCAWSALYREEQFSEEVCARLLSVLTRGAAGVRRDDPVFRRFPELVRLHQLRLDRLHVPDVTIFLDVPPEVCVERIESRGERKQVHETREKLARLRDAYLLVTSVLARRVGTPVLVLEGDRDPDTVTAEARAFVESARKVLHDR